MPVPRLHWTPQSDAITYVDRRDGVANVWLQPASGGPPKPLIRFNWVRFSPFLLVAEWNANPLART